MVDEGAAFGKFLNFRLAAIKKALGEQRYRDVLKHWNIGSQTIAELEDGHRVEVKIDLLLRLAALAEANKVAYPRVTESALWATFRGASAFQMLAAEDSKDYSFDFSVKLQKYLGTACTFGRSDPALTEEAVRGLMVTTNVLLIGNGLRNMATEFALTLLWNGKTPVEFWHPEQTDDGRRKKTVRPSKDGSKGLRIVVPHTVRRLRQDDGRLVGVVAWAANPLGNGDVATIVVAGCSRQSTRAMLVELEGQRFYNVLADAIPGKPALMIYDSKEKGGWSLVGGPRRPLGRPSIVRGTA